MINTILDKLELQWRIADIYFLNNIQLDLICFKLSICNQIFAAIKIILHQFFNKFCFGCMKKSPRYPLSDTYAVDASHPQVSLSQRFWRAYVRCRFDYSFAVKSLNLPLVSKMGESKIYTIIIGAIYIPFILASRRYQLSLASKIMICISQLRRSGGLKAHDFMQMSNLK